MSKQTTTQALTLEVNGTRHSLAVPPETPLLSVLRNDLGLNGPKYGCGLGQCGACTVLVEGVAARACVIPAGGAAGRAITTLEGLGNRERPHPVQQAFIDSQAAQCGYCLNGMIMTATALLARCPHPTEADVRRALSGNLCRCGAHLEIVEAVLRAADLLAETGSEAAPAAAVSEPAAG
ncbi:MAG TPA: (2Fe-2S)-binding protein [Burkholderiaceae bacterium]|nr:(2Fe-2S)-binding protein [Burkholderiaceae bacterium]